MGYDENRVKAYLRWAKKRFKDNSPEWAWTKIQDNPKWMKDYLSFDKKPPEFSEASVNVEFCVRTYGWREMMRALWILASRKEETMYRLGLEEEESKWRKVKDKLASMPKNVQR